MRTVFRINCVAVIIIILFTIGCQTTQQRLLDSDSSQVEIRSIQTRAFDTADKETTLRTVISTLQDLGFVINKADAYLGSVDAIKLDHYGTRMQVYVRSHGEDQIDVRADAQYDSKTVKDPKVYHTFFVALEKAMFLKAHQIQ